MNGTNQVILLRDYYGISLILFFFNRYWFPFSSIKVVILKLFGAKVGRHVVIKPKVNIKISLECFIRKLCVDRRRSYGWIV